MPILLTYVLVFLVVGVVFILANLLVGALVRPAKPDPEKATVYECGEPTVGSSYIQFDLRYYVVALLFVIFDVEVTFFFPWAVVFGKLNALADPRMQVTAEMSDQDYQTTLARRAEAVQALVPPHVKRQPSLFIDYPPPAERSKDQVIADIRSQARDANTMAWVAFADLAVFFAVLLVGFAYLWQRGDINWVKSVGAEREETEDLTGTAGPTVVRVAPAEVSQPS
jgi:NADH-quinone oxidoreductase subunit A